MKLCSWNVRGFNDPSKCSELKHFLSSQHLTVFGLLETRVKSNKVAAIRKRLGSCWQWTDNNLFRLKGGFGLVGLMKRLICRF